MPGLRGVTTPAATARTALLPIASSAKAAATPFTLVALPGVAALPLALAATASAMLLAALMTAVAALARLAAVLEVSALPMLAAAAVLTRVENGRALPSS